MKTGNFCLFYVSCQLMHLTLYQQIVYICDHFCSPFFWNYLFGVYIIISVDLMPIIQRLDCQPTGVASLFQSEFGLNKNTVNKHLDYQTMYSKRTRKINVKSLMFQIYINHKETFYIPSTQILKLVNWIQCMGRFLSSLLKHLVTLYRLIYWILFCLLIYLDLLNTK